MFNHANNLNYGSGVKRNIDKACEYYYKAMKAGFFGARISLDEILP